jgi:hypothetical protein
VNEDGFPAAIPGLSALTQHSEHPAYDLADVSFGAEPVYVSRYGKNFRASFV